METIRFSINRQVATLQIHRPAAANSINAELIREMRAALQSVADNKEVSIVVIEGNTDNFCTGMDFNEVTSNGGDSGDPGEFYDLLTECSFSSKVIVCKVEGKVNAGGMGLLAAADIVIVDEKVTFGLSEALFGLIPAMVMPFLIRRIGYQKALWLTLTTQGISAQKAQQMGLVDEVSNNVSETLRKLLLRLVRLEPDTIYDIKDYMSRLWIINNETRTLAVDKITSLVTSEKVQTNIENFIKKGKFPWDKQ